MVIRMPNEDPQDPYDFTQESVGPVGPADEDGVAPKAAESGGPRLTDQLGGPFAVRVSETTEKHREGTRRWLAFGLLLLLAAIALLSVGAVILGLQNTDDVKSIADVVFPPIVALTGSALGFYFGSERGALERGAPSSDAPRS
jgi:hypothetical protein